MLIISNRAEIINEIKIVRNTGQDLHFYIAIIIIIFKTSIIIQVN